MNQEIEAKFLIQDLNVLKARLVVLEAVCTQARVFEENLRFDTPEQSLSRSARVLRLRRDTAARMTFKSGGQILEGVLTRTEFEVEVSDFTKTRLILEGLGYQVFMTYQKYRQNFLVDDLIVSLDEMPFGFFAELEGPSAERVKEVAQLLGLDWSARINDSYLGIFESFKQRKGLLIRDLSFEVFKGLDVTAEDLGYRYADKDL